MTRHTNGPSRPPLAVLLLMSFSSVTVFLPLTCFHVLAYIIMVNATIFGGITGFVWLGIWGVLIGVSIGGVLGFLLGWFGMFLVLLIGPVPGEDESQ